MPKMPKISRKKTVAFFHGGGANGPGPVGIDAIPYGNVMIINE